MVALAGSIEAVAAPTAGDVEGSPAGEDRLLLQSLVQGKTNREIAEELGIDEIAVTRRLGELFAAIGASSRAEATAFAFREHVL
jgi:DNA-binding NarL/FixJ family response regulator